MGQVPDGMEIDRIDNNGDYCKDNCRWATTLQQARNKSNNKLITAFGTTKNLSAWAESTGFRYGLILKRLNLGWTAERALTTPILRRSQW